MDYGDSRVCKTLAGEFESVASHKNMLLSSNGRTPASQADVNAGSIPVKSTKRIFECKQVQYQSLGPYRQWTVVRMSLFGDGYQATPSILVHSTIG